MKIHIWITRKDAMNGRLDPADYYIRKPLKNPRFWDYVQVSITSDEFTILEDCNDFMHNQLNDWKSDYWLKEQHSKNRKYEDKIKSISEIKMSVFEDIEFDKPYKTHKVFNLFPDYKDITLEKFAKWWGNMPEDKKEKFTEIFTKGDNEKNK